MAELAREVLLDTESGLLMVDGVEFPWLYTGGEPVVESLDGTSVPGITITLYAASMEIISGRSVIDEQG